MNKYTRRGPGAERVLDYDKIKAMIEDNNSYAYIAKNAGCSKHHVWRLKKRWGLIPDRWAVEK